MKKIEFKVFGESKKTAGYPEELNAELLKTLVVLQALTVDTIRNGVSDQNLVLLRKYCKNIEQLILQGANPNLQLPSKLSPLHFSVFLSDIELLEMLLKRPDIKLDVVDTEGQSILHTAVAGKRLLPTLMVLDAFKNDPEHFFERFNKRNSKGLTAIDYAVFFEDVRFLKILLSYGVSEVNLEESLKDAENNLTKDPQASAAKIELVRRARETVLECREFHNFPDLEIMRIGQIVDCMQFGGEINQRYLKIFEQIIHKEITELVLVADNQKSVERVFAKSLTTANLLKFPPVQMINNPEVIAHWRDITRASSGYLLELAAQMATKKFSIDDSLIQIMNPVQLAKDFGLPEYVKRFTDLGFEISKPKAARVIKADSKASEQVLEPEKSPQERLEILLRNLQRDAVTNKKEKNSEGTNRSVLYLLQQTNSTPDVTTTNNWTPLHLAARLGNVELLESLLAMKCNVNAVTSEGFSVLDCAVASVNRETFKKVLELPDLDLMSVSSVLKNSFKARNKILVSDILGSQNVLTKVAALGKKESTALLQDWRVFNNNNASAAAKEFKEKISVFEQALNSLTKVVEKKPDQEEGSFAPTLSKKEREKNRKEEKRLKRQEEEKEKLEKEKKRQEIEAKRKEEESKRQSEINLMSQEDFDVPQLVILQQRQVQNFLASNRVLNSLSDLPEFLQPKAQKFLQTGCEFSIKGSAVYPRAKGSRVPADLDLELLVPKIRDCTDEQVISFVEENFGVKIDVTQIYRDRYSQNTVFSLNFKDSERDLDITIYDLDPKFSPPSHLGWTHSREYKISFNSDGSARKVRPIGLEQKVSELREKGTNFNYETDFLINTQSRGLVTRLCFLQTIDQISGSDFEKSFRQILPSNPVDLVFKELKLDLKKDASSEEKTIRSKIAGFTKAHNLDQNAQAKFLQNLNWAMSLNLNQKPNFKQDPRYGVLFATVEEIAKEFSQNPNVNLQKPNEVKKLQKASDKALSPSSAVTRYNNSF